MYTDHKEASRCGIFCQYYTSIGLIGMGTSGRKDEHPDATFACLQCTSILVNQGVFSLAIGYEDSPTLPAIVQKRTPLFFGGEFVISTFVWISSIKQATVFSEGVNQNSKIVQDLRMESHVHCVAVAHISGQSKTYILIGQKRWGDLTLSRLYAYLTRCEIFYSRRTRH